MQRVNAEIKGLYENTQVIAYSHVSNATRTCCGTYRAPCWIGSDISSPYLPGMILTEKEQIVLKPDEDMAQEKTTSQNKLKK